MSKFKVGDDVRKPCGTDERCVVDGYDSTGQYINGYRGVVIGLTGADTVRVKLDFAHNSEVVEVGWRQCRRIVKKPRRRVWVALDLKAGQAIGEPFYAYLERPPTENAWREFVEVKPKRGKP